MHVGERITTKNSKEHTHKCMYINMCVRKYVFMNVDLPAGNIKHWGCILKMPQLVEDQCSSSRNVICMYVCIKRRIRGFYGTEDMYIQTDTHTYKQIF